MNEGATSSKKRFSSSSRSHLQAFYLQKCIFLKQQCSSSFNESQDSRKTPQIANIVASTRLASTGFSITTGSISSRSSKQKLDTSGCRIDLKINFFIFASKSRQCKNTRTAFHFYIDIKPTFLCYCGFHFFHVGTKQKHFKIEGKFG